MRYSPNNVPDQPQDEDPGDVSFARVNNRLAPDQLQPGELADAANVRLRDGRARARLGVCKPGWLNAVAAGSKVIGPVGTVYGSGVFKDPNSFEWVLIAVDGAVYRHKSHNARISLALPTGVKLLSPCTFIQAFNQVICFRGRYLAPLVMTSIDTGFADLVQRWSSGSSYNAAVLPLGRAADEVAYGPFQTLTSLTSSLGVATATLATPHGFVSGADITVRGATPSTYNGRFNITVINDVSFSYVMPSPDTSPATGTITVSNMAYYYKALGSKITLTSLGRVTDYSATLSSLTSASTTATATTPSAHGLTTGDTVVIAGGTPSGYNGSWVITVTGANTFTFTLPGVLSSPATGTITVKKYSTTTASAVKTSHGFTSGQYSTIAGATPSVYNGTFVITVIDADTFTYVPASTLSADATGTITAQTSVTLAGQSPDTNPEAWQQIYNVLPNADDALYINNQLLVPTAYTPGASAYDSTSSYTKKDYIVAMNYLDPVHFDFVNDFRINQGSDDEIQALVKYGTNTAVVFKTKSWGVLSNIALDLTQVSLDMRDEEHGCCAVRAAVIAGKNVFYASSKRGICSLFQNEFGQARSTDIPHSDDVQGWIDRINWPLGSLIRLAYWDDKLYCAVPIDDGAVTTTSIVVSGAGSVVANGTYALNGTLNGRPLYGDPASKRIYWDGTQWVIYMSDGVSYQGQYSGFGQDVASPLQVTSWLAEFGARSPSPTLTNAMVTGSNNAILVYDFRTAGWQSLDQGPAICPVEFFKAQYNGVERLGFIGADGYISLLEEHPDGDQVQDVGAPDGLSFVAVQDSRTTRGYRLDTDNPKQFKRVQAVVETWNARFTVTRNGGAANDELTVLPEKTFSRTNYLKPFNKAAWDGSNASDDHADSGRGDYSLVLGTGLNLKSGVSAGTGQEFNIRRNLRTFMGRYVQFTIDNTQGWLSLKSAGSTAEEGQRRDGILL